MTISSISSPVKATICVLYARGGKLAFAGGVHKSAGELTVVRLEGRFGTVPVLHLSCPDPKRLFEPRIVDMLSGELIVQGMELLTDGSWVAQAWKICFGEPEL